MPAVVWPHTGVVAFGAIRATSRQEGRTNDTHTAGGTVEWEIFALHNYRCYDDMHI